MLVIIIIIITIIIIIIIIIIIYVELASTVKFIRGSPLFSRRPREHEGTERDTEGVGCDMS